jgi:hypothetical protein
MSLPYSYCYGSYFGDYFTMNVEAKLSFETWVLTRPKLRHIPEDGILGKDSSLF